MKYTVAIFDLDDTLIHEGFEIPIKCADALDVLKLAKENGCIVCLATLNEDALDLCKQVDLSKYIDFTVAIDIESKLTHFIKIMEYCDCVPSEMLVFDDVYKHILEARSIGINGCLVDWKTGVTLHNANLL